MPSTAKKLRAFRRKKFPLRKGMVEYMAKLLILESPSKSKTVGKFLGRGYKVVASGGHIVDLPKSELGVDIEHGFEPEYQTIRSKSTLINASISPSRRPATAATSTRAVIRSSTMSPTGPTTKTCTSPA